MRNFFRFHLDSVGFWTSLICAAHCVAVPVILLFFSLSSLKVFESSVIEPVILSISLVIATLSLLPGYFRHGKPAAILYLIGGFMLIGISRLNVAGVVEVITASGGALLVATAHYTNWKLSQSHKEQSAGQ